MPSTLHDAPPATVWHSISVDSARLIKLTGNGVPSQSTFSAESGLGTKHNVAISVSLSFPAPSNIISDFISLGIRLDVAQYLSSNYLRAVDHIRIVYEEQYHRTNETCAQIATVASDTILPNLLTRLRDGFVARYMSLQHRWAREALLVAQQTLLASSLDTSHRVSNNPFAKFLRPYKETLIPANSASLTSCSHPSWKLTSQVPSPVFDQTKLLVFEAHECTPTSSPTPTTKLLKHSGLMVLPTPVPYEPHPCSESMRGLEDCLSTLYHTSLNMVAMTDRAPQVVDSSLPGDTTSSHTALPPFTVPSSKESSLQIDTAHSSSASTASITPPVSPSPATVTKRPRRKLAALPKRSIKETASPLSVPTPTPPSSEFQFKPSEPKLPSSTLQAKSIFAADVSCSSGSVFSPLAARAPAPSSFLSLALAKDETSAAATSPTSHTTNVQTVSPPPTTHPLFGRPSMAPLPSRHTVVYSETSASSDGPSRSSVVLASLPISRMSFVASDESESSATVSDPPSTPSSSQPSTDFSPLLPAWSPTSPPPSKGRRRKVAPLPSRHLANEPTFPTFNEKYSRETSFTPTSPPSRAPSLEPAFSDASTSPEPDTLPTPPSSPPGFSFSAPVILSPESHVSEPLLFAFAQSRSEHDNGEFHFGSPPPTSRPLQKGRLDFGFPSIDQTLQGSSASFSFSFDRPS